jgi:F-type H+-transporting ATPase subunit epsilon
MSKLFDLTIVEPEKVLYEGQASSLIARSAEGYLGVLADHAPLAANLVTGKIILTDETGKTFNFYCQGTGFMEVAENEVTILLNQTDTQILH